MVWYFDDGCYCCDLLFLYDPSATKETKRDEKIEIKILSKYDQIKKLLSKYPKEMTAEDT